MAGAFAVAAAVLVADPNMGTDATYARAGAAWSPVAVRIGLSRPQELFPLAHARGAVLDARHAMLPAAAIPVDPLRGDTLTIAGVASVISVAELDAEGIAWTLVLKDPDAG